MTNYNLWINKYKPLIIDDIIGNANQINLFNDWLNNLDKIKNQSIIITGNQGIGKTTIIKLLLEQKNYIVRIIKSYEIKDHRNLDDFNDYHNFIMSIYSKLTINNNNNNNNIALVFDETENITLTSEKKYIIDIYKENNKIKNFPLIFISNNQHSKLLYDLKKCCKEINFTNPTVDELKYLINKIYKNENIILENFDENSIKIINFSQFDIRKLINIIEELSYHKINNIITNNIVNTYLIKSKEKNIDTGLFDASNKILNNYLDYDIIIKLYETEKVLLPLMIHENYIKKLYCNNITNMELLLNNIINIADSFSKGDNIETSIYTDQNWYLQNIHGFYTCINTSYWINKINNNFKISDIVFSSDLNKTSLKNINKKNINNLSKIISNKNNLEILMLNKIANSFIKNNKENILIEKLSAYNKDITIKEIELSLKIDKTNDISILNTKDKKRIIKSLKNN
jgi:hypothetical protein